MGGASGLWPTEKTKNAGSALRCVQSTGAARKGGVVARQSPVGIGHVAQHKVQRHLQNGVPVGTAHLTRKKESSAAGL